jgi:hypothetical protein
MLENIGRAASDRQGGGDAHQFYRGRFAPRPLPRIRVILAVSRGAIDPRSTSPQ